MKCGVPGPVAGRGSRLGGNGQAGRLVSLGFRAAPPLRRPRKPEPEGKGLGLEVTERLSSKVTSYCVILGKAVISELQLAVPANWGHPWAAFKGSV